MCSQTDGAKESSENCGSAPPPPPPPPPPPSSCPKLDTVN